MTKRTRRARAKAITPATRRTGQVVADVAVARVAGFVPRPPGYEDHPQTCAGCLRPDAVAAAGWPVPCPCRSGRWEVAGWHYGRPLTLYAHPASPAQIHRLDCPYWDHVPGMPSSELRAAGILPGAGNDVTGERGGDRPITTPPRESAGSGTPPPYDEEGGFPDDDDLPF